MSLEESEQDLSLEQQLKIFWYRKPRCVLVLKITLDYRCHW